MDQHIKDFLDQFKPDYIVSMVSGGKDSAASHQYAQELGIKIDAVIHGNTRCGIPETTNFVRDVYSKDQDYIEADAGTAYQDYVLRKGFFGKGISAHAYAYRILKATPFRKAISVNFRKRKRGIKIMLLNGARKDESANRMKNLERFRSDPAQKGNVWFNIIHDWSQEIRDQYLDKMQTPINPVAKALCRSGECMCGTMQSKAQRIEAAALYPDWGANIDALEAEAKRLHGYGWGEEMPEYLKAQKRGQYDLFQPMCNDCVKEQP
jgi:3'-phosphoadenosine 5'-phosphosulfate sulfotransferase (PAPS reductase)/FAD synthetase